MTQSMDSPVVTQAQFQCTYEDFREANHGHIGAIRGANRQQLLRGLLAWFLFALLAILYVFLLGHAEGRNVAERCPVRRRRAGHWPFVSPKPPCRR